MKLFKNTSSRTFNVFISFAVLFRYTFRSGDEFVDIDNTIGARRLFITLGYLEALSHIENRELE